MLGRTPHPNTTSLRPRNTGIVLQRLDTLERTILVAIDRLTRDSQAIPVPPFRIARREDVGCLEGQTDEPLR